MPRKTATNATQEQPISVAPAVEEHTPAAENFKVPEIADPKAIMTASLGTHNADPKIELLRSQRFNQMQLRAEEPLTEKHQAMLKEAGWTDRTEQEGIYTKQLPKEGEKWRVAADAEKMFKQITNDIRADKGLGGVLSL
jgi:hypothetical protein